jgi:hypothetical protein
VIEMLRAVVPPLVAAYLAFVAMVVLAARRGPARRERRPRPVNAREARRHVVETTVGGYVAFLAIVLVFHVWLADERDVLPDALWGGGLLSLLALGLAVGGSLIRGRRGQRP